MKFTNKNLENHFNSLDDYTKETLEDNNFTEDKFDALLCYSDDEGLFLNKHTVVKLLESFHKQYVGAFNDVYDLVHLWFEKNISNYILIPETNLQLKDIVDWEKIKFYLFYSKHFIYYPLVGYIKTFYFKRV